MHTDNPLLVRDQAMGSENPKDWYLPAEPGVPAGDQPLIATSPPLRKQEFAISSRDQNSSRRQQGGINGGQ